MYEDVREVLIQVTFAALHFIAALHHTRRAVLVLAGKKLPPGY
jgi:hypothetical protein